MFNIIVYVTKKHFEKAKEAVEGTGVREGLGLGSESGRG